MVEKVIHELKTKLSEYLDLKGVEKRNNRYICINPSHLDSNPSSTIYTNDSGEQHLKCWSCDIGSLDIFAACHTLENKPISGQLFFSETVPYLASLFNIDLPNIQLSESKKEEILFKRIYKDAEDFILNYESVPENIEEELKKRGWTDLSKIKKLGIGFISSFERFRSYLKEKGHLARIIEESGLSDPIVFNENRLIFSYRDEDGNPVGFIARNLNFVNVKNDNGFLNGPKYLFNKNPRMVKLLNKERRLFLFDKAKKTSDTLYIVEGQPDSVSFHYHGHSNFVSLSGTSMSLQHFELIRKYGIYDVVICLDNDEAGIRSADSLVDIVIKHVNDIRVRFIFLPLSDGKIDPDLMVRNGQIEDFFLLPKVNAFDFRIEKVMSSIDGFDNEILCGKIIPTIASDPSPLRREGMISSLSNYTGINEKILKEEVKRILDGKAKKILSLKNDIISKLATKISSSESPTESMSLISECLETLKEIDKENSSDALDRKVLLSKLFDIKRYEEGDSLLKKIKVDSNIEKLINAFDGDLSQKVILLPAPPNTGC